MVDPAKRTTGFVNSLARGLSILEAFDSGNPEMGITELYQRTSLPKSTVHRLIKTLCDLGYVKPVEAENKYTLGPKVLSLGFTVLSSLELREVAHPYLKDLSKSIGETVNLAILDKWQLVYVERVKTQQIVNINLHIGSRLELFNTSMGRVLAAFQSEDWKSEYMRYLKKIPEAKNYWRDNGKKLMEILNQVKDSGYAINDEDLAPGLRSVAFPVKNREGKVEGAVNIAVSSSLYSIERLKAKLVLPLEKTTQAISSALGYN
ncbi:MAG: IclR family transcriptional regulator [Candidatus Aminicenantes bacterium]|nr:IclR family transcriptional regulator [Candidatus Aminicenantes bacterium]